MDKAADMQKYWVIIPAAGTGERFAAQKPKQYMPLAGKTVIEHSLQPFLDSPDIAKVIVVIAEHDNYWQQLPIAKHSKIISCVGGASRSESVLAGLKTLRLYATDNDWVLVHDAARPCFSGNNLMQLINQLTDNKIGGITAVPVADTLKKAEQNNIETTIERKDLWQAQTPQMFRYQLLVDALQQHKQVTDEAMAIEAMGQAVKLVPGSRQNIKVTFPEDLLMAEQFLSATTTMRIGHGYDVHAFAENRKLILGGVEVPHSKGLQGHSDADVVLHAVCDALLGAAALGDIGQHFPDTDSAHENADSRTFLREIYRKILAEGYRLVNVDVTILAQQPKLAPHIATMVANIAEDCQVQSQQVNVKATTTEKLGFIGQEQGIASEAVVLLEGVSNE